MTDSLAARSDVISFAVIGPGFPSRVVNPFGTGFVSGKGFDTSRLHEVKVPGGRRTATHGFR
jgi:hypothetical protein